MITWTTPRIARLAAALPRNTQPRSLGSSARPASASFSSSREKARFMPRIEANT
jgi:hypothetical protein